MRWDCLWSEGQELWKLDGWNSDVLRLDGIDELLAKKEKKMRMVKNELIAKDQMMAAVCQVKLI